MVEVSRAQRAERFAAVKGMNDVLAPESATWEWLEARVRALMSRYAYRNIRTPIVEPTALFVRGLGEVALVYSLQQRGHLATEFEMVKAVEKTKAELEDFLTRFLTSTSSIIAPLPSECSFDTETEPLFEA